MTFSLVPITKKLQKFPFDCGYPYINWSAILRRQSLAFYPGIGGLSNLLLFF
jgi:hypothetical protein